MLEQQLAPPWPFVLRLVARGAAVHGSTIPVTGAEET